MRLHPRKETTEREKFHAYYGYTERVSYRNALKRCATSIYEDAIIVMRSHLLSPNA